MHRFLLSISLILSLLVLSPQTWAQRDLIKSLESGSLTESYLIKATHALSIPEARSNIEKAIGKAQPFPRKKLVNLLSHKQLIVRIGSLELLENAAGEDFGFNPWDEPEKSESNGRALQRWKEWSDSDSKIETSLAKLSEEQIQNYIQQLLSVDRNRVQRALRMLENNNFHAVSAIQLFIIEHPEFPEVKRLQLKQAQYELVLIKANRSKAAGLARDLVKGNRDQQLTALSQLKKIGLIAIPIIRDFTSEEDALTRETAMDALLSVGGAQVLPLVVEDLEKETDVNVLHVALKNIKGISNPQSIAIATKLLKHEDEDIVVGSIQALTKLEKEASSNRSSSKANLKSDSPVLPFLHDSRWRVRVAAVNHVTKLQLKAAGPSLVKLLKEDDDEFVRSHCIQAAVAIKLTDSLPTLKKLFFSNDELIGALTPAIIELSKSVPADLLKHLKTREPDTIISALAAFTDDKKPILTVVANYAQHADLDVACAALRILANDEDKLKFDFVTNTLTDSLKSGSEEKIQAILTSIDLPRMKSTDPRLFLSANKSRSTSTVLDPIYSAFLMPGGKPLTPARPTVKTDSTGGLSTLLATLSDLANEPENSKRTFQISLILTKAGDPRGLKLINENIAEMPVSKRSSLADSLNSPSSAETLPIFEVLLEDPADDIRKEAGRNAFSNDKNLKLIKLALDHVARENTLLKPSEITQYYFFSALKKPGASSIMQDWANDQLANPASSDKTKILALTINRKAIRAPISQEAIELTKSTNPWVRRAAWHSIAIKKSSASTEQLLSITKDASPYVRAILAEISSKERTNWKIYFSDSEFSTDSSYSSSRSRRRLSSGLEDALRVIAEIDSSVVNQFEANFSLLTHSRDIDLPLFIALLSKTPKETNAIRRLTDYVEDNFKKMGKGMAPLLAYIDFKRINVRYHKKILEHFKSDENDNESFHSFQNLAKTTQISDAPQHIEVEEQAPVSDRTQLITLFFEKEGCTQCAKALEVMEDLKTDFPLLKIQHVSMSSNEGILLNDHLSNKFTLPSNAIGKTPSIFTSEGYITPPITAVKLGELLEKTMASQRDEEAWFQISNPEQIAAAEERVDARYDSLTLPIVIAGGLLDGINPCAFATIIFFLSYLGVAKRSSKEIFLVGSAFILAIFLSYLSVGLVFNEIIGKLTENSSYLWLKNTLNYVFAGFALLVAVLSLRDFWRARQGRLSEMTLQLPTFLKNRIRGVIRKGAKSSRFVIAAFFSGIAISFLELACTGQVYAPIIYKINQGASNAAYMLILYNLAFILPLIIIFGLAMGGMKSSALIAFQTKHTATVKLLTGILFLLLAAVLIFSDYFSGFLKDIQPALLNLLG